MIQKSPEEILQRYCRIADMESLRYLADEFAVQGDMESLDMVCDESELRTEMDIMETSRLTHEIYEQNRKDKNNG